MVAFLHSIFSTLTLSIQPPSTSISMSQPTSPTAEPTDSAAPLPESGTSNNAADVNQMEIPSDNTGNDGDNGNDAPGGGNVEEAHPPVASPLPDLINDESTRPAQLAVHQYLRDEPHLGMDGSLNLDGAKAWLQVNIVSSKFCFKLHLLNIMCSGVVVSFPQAQQA